jgi:hypothetical protein
MRKVLKTRAQFQGDDAVVKTLWLAIVDIKVKRAEARATQATKPASERNSAPRLIEGHVTICSPAEGSNQLMGVGIGVD